MSHPWQVYKQRFRPKYPILHSLTKQPKPAAEKVIKIVPAKAQLAILSKNQDDATEVKSDKNDEGWNGQWSD